MNEVEMIHFDGSEEALIREQMVRYYDSDTGFEAAWQTAMEIPGDERQKYYAVLRDLEADLSNGHCFEENGPLAPARGAPIKEMATSAMAATTLFVSTCKEAVQRFGANSSEG